MNNETINEVFGSCSGIFCEVTQVGNWFGCFYAAFAWFIAGAIGFWILCTIFGDDDFKKDWTKAITAFIICLIFGPFIIVFSLWGGIGYWSGRGTAFLFNDELNEESAVALAFLGPVTLAFFILIYIGFMISSPLIVADLRGKLSKMEDELNKWKRKYTPKKSKSLRKKLSKRKKNQKKPAKRKKKSRPRKAG